MLQNRWRNLRRQYLLARVAGARRVGAMDDEHAVLDMVRSDAHSIFMGDVAETGILK